MCSSLMHLLIMVKESCAVFYLNALVLVLMGAAVSGLSGRGAGGQPAEQLVHHGNILSPLLKALSEHEPWGTDFPRTRPDSRYVRFMKRLYKLSTKHERSHEASHLYNTVRLITARQECLDQCGELFMQDISYSLNRVRAQEQLLKSVLLYSLDHNHAASLTSHCYLYMKEQTPSDEHMCLSSPSSQHSVSLISFYFLVNRAGHHKWVEVDVTPFLHPLIQGHKKDIHLHINLTCLDDEPGRHTSRSLVELTHMAPSLLLYLNDTSEVAYQRGSTHTRFGEIWSNHWGENTQSQYYGSGIQRLKWRDRRSAPNTTQSSTESGPLPTIEHPTDDCDLYDFRVSFSQLRLDHWIIAPSKYNPRYCKGICPRVVGHIYGSPVHTMVQNIIYEKLDSSMPRPSCVPSVYDPLSVLTIENDGSIAYKEYEEMIATKCTCR
ncbi:growth/differentiation factor 9 isoform X1 [Ictalurus punctatus]|uniref:Growth/differentiation factor 9 n=1 Tax=Ictalurus punctatus TaxID=7998 RepID=A0A2D0SBW5_ICTPU|nr:growth/differentiation factor 9 isoform X1 [Ictalurus punctatus]